ncbi:unnamed protein product [Rhodiola kirilowii]
MTEKGAEAGDVSVEVNSGIEVKLNKVGNEVETGLESNEKGDAHSDGSENGVMANGTDDSDNSNVFVPGSNVMVENGGKKGDSSDVLEESNVGEVLEESNVGEVLEDSNVGEVLEESNVGEVLEESNYGEVLKDSNVGEVLKESNVGEVVKESNVSEVLEEPNVSEDLEESNVSEGLEESIMNSGSKVDEVESLNEGPKPEDVESSRVVENAASLISKDGLDGPMGESNGCEKNDVKVDGESEPREVENGLTVEEYVGVDSSHKLDNVQEAVNATSDDHKSYSQQIINDMVENEEVALEVSDPRVEEKLDSEFESTQSNESELIVDESKRENNEESSVGKKEIQECTELGSSDAQQDSVELKQAYPIKAIVESFSDNADNDKDTQHTEEESRLENKSEHSSNVKENTKCESLVAIDAQIDFNKEEEIDSAKISPPESSAEVIFEAFPNEHHDLQSRKLENISEPSSDGKENTKCESLVAVDAHLDFIKEEENDSAKMFPMESSAEFTHEASPNEHDDSQSTTNIVASGNEENNIDLVSNLDESQKTEAASAVSEEVPLDSTEQEEKGLEYETHVVENGNQTPEVEPPSAKDILLSSIDQEKNELASDMNVGQHSDLGTECANGLFLNANGNDVLAVDVDVVTPDNDTGDSVVPTDNEWPELSYYNTKEKINIESHVDACRSHESEITSVEKHLAVPDIEGIFFNNITSDDGNNFGHKKIADASLSGNSDSACPDSETSKETNHNGQSTPGAGDNDQTNGISTPVLSTCSQSPFDGVASAANLESEFAISGSRNKDDETNVNGNIEAPKVETSLSADEESSLTAVESEADRCRFFFLVKVPRFEDDDIRERISSAQREFDQKTKLRDSYDVQIQATKTVCQEFDDELEAAKLEEKAARDKLKAKRTEIDAAQAVIDKVNNAMTVEGMDGDIRKMEHKMQHETIPLSEEKQLMRDIKRLKHFRDQLSSSIGSNEELQKAMDQKDHIKDHLKSLKRELESIRSDVQKAESVTKAAKKKCFDKYSVLHKLKLEYRAADRVCQEAYTSLVSLRRELAQKNKFFRMYKDNEKAANYHALSGDKEALHSLCVNQVEMVMKMWNTNDEFRNDYVKCNAIRTLRRLKTLDGRSLGLDEEPPSLPYVRNERIIHSQGVTNITVTNSLSQFPSLEQSKIPIPSIAEKPVEEPVLKIVEKKEAKKQSEPTAAVSEVLTVRDQEPTQEEKEEAKRTKEEEEFAKRAEEKRKKEEEVKRMEQRRLEEKAKAKEALERKKKLAEKAQARAELRAKKEAEHREKEREKRQRKKENKKTPGGAKEQGNEKELMAVRETQAELTKETKLTEKPLTHSKRHHKPSNYPKVPKTNAMPLPLRNRGRRKMQMWMWIGASSFAAAALVLLGIWYFSYKPYGERFHY